MIVSHTNTAVDGAIEKVQDLRNEDGTCPVLRLGIPQKNLSPDVELNEHIRILGAQLIERLEALKKQQQEKNEFLHENCQVLSKFTWIKSTHIDQLNEAFLELLDLEKKRDYAQAKYKMAAEELKCYKEDHPEIQEYTKLKSVYEQKCQEKENEELSVVALQQQMSKKEQKLQYCSEEIDKFMLFANLQKEIKTMMPESFYIARVNEQSKQLQSLELKKAECLGRISHYEQVISKGHRNAVAAFFSKKALQQAEMDLAKEKVEIQDIEGQIKKTTTSKKETSVQADHLKELKKLVSSIVTTHTKEYWEEQKGKVQTEIIALRSRLDSHINSINILSSEISSLGQKIEYMVSAYSHFFKLIKHADDAKKEETDAEQSYADQVELCESLADDEKNACEAFASKLFGSSQSLSQKIDILQGLRTEVQSLYTPELEAELVKLIDSTHQELANIKSELVVIEDQINSLERQAILKAKIVGATLAKAYLSDILQEAPFDTVILDEASMASIPALWCASYIAKRNIVIVGDFLQLPPIVMAETAMAKKWLGRDIFEVSGMQENAKRKENKPTNFVMLNDQFRMEKEIADIANLYYGEYGGLQSHDDTPDRVEARKRFVEWSGRKISRSVQIIDTASLHAWVTGIPQGKSHSRLNCFSAALVVEFAFSWLTTDIAEVKATKQAAKCPRILIVAPYKPHVDRVKQLVKFEYEQRGLNEDANLIKVGTIHGFQGNEADIVIFDLVIDEPHWKANLFMTGEEITAEMDKLFNVAVTRAKFKLFIVGNIKYCRQRAKGNSLSKLLDYLIDEQKFPVTDAKKLYPNLLMVRDRTYVGEGSRDARNVICREDEFYDYFLGDVRGIKRRMIIYSPFITSNRLSQLLPYFNDAIKLGKQIIIVTKALEDRSKTELAQYKHLEEEMTFIGIQIIHKKGMHEKLIFVDDSAVWTGSLNALSFSGVTGEVMHRIHDAGITGEYEKIYNIQHIQDAVDQQAELLCPICGKEMLLCEGSSDVYWKCSGGDYTRSIDQQYPFDGVIRCKCGGEYHFDMKKQPRWICDVDSRHFQQIRSGDLKLPLMHAKIPARSVKDVERYLNEKKNQQDTDEPAAEFPKKSRNNKQA